MTLGLGLPTRLSLSFLRGQQVRLVHGLGHLPRPPALDSVTPETEKDARSWLTSFRTLSTIPSELVELSFSRSSGPGGQVKSLSRNTSWNSLSGGTDVLPQNVNKLSTKVTVRCPLNSAWIPPWARESLMRSPYYVKSSHSLLLTCSTSRSQASNREEALSKLHALVVQSAASQIVNSPTEEQRRRISDFQKADDARRRVQKDKRSSVKKSRSKDWD